MTGWFKNHQLIAFFVLCYALSWGTRLPVTYASLILEAIVTVIVILSSRMWKKLPADSPAAYQAG
jgi:hypothetical protein